MHGQPANCSGALLLAFQLPHIVVELIHAKLGIQLRVSSRLFLLRVAAAAQAQLSVMFRWLVIMLHPVQATCQSGWWQMVACLSAAVQLLRHCCMKALPCQLSAVCTISATLHSHWLPTPSFSILPACSAYARSIAFQLTLELVAQGLVRAGAYLGSKPHHIATCNSCSSCQWLHLQDAAYGFAWCTLVLVQRKGCRSAVVAPIINASTMRPALWQRHCHFVVVCLVACLSA